MASYNEIIKIFSDYVTANYVIKSFGNGDTSELVETFGLKDAEYPKMWAEDMPNTTAVGEESFKFRIYMLGQVATLKEKTTTTLGEDNTNEVKSNMRQNCIDLLSYLLQQTNYPEITSDRNVTLTSFVDKYNDKLTGWYFDLSIKQALSFSACIIPMDGIPLPPAGICADAVVTNSDGTYTVNVVSGGTLNLPDVINIDSDGTPTPTPAQTPFICNSGAVGLNSSELTKSGATVSFQSKDDGDLEQGSGVDFLTLSYNNKFGNTNRFTDDLGTQIYASDVVVDWSTFNQVNDTVLAYKKTVVAQAILATHLAGQPYTNGGFSGWYLCNIKQLINIANLGIYRNVLNYPPFNYNYITSGNRIWSSTMESSTTAYMLTNTSLGIVAGITQNYRTFLCRIYTLTELGL